MLAGKPWSRVVKFVSQAFVFIGFLASLGFFFPDARILLAVFAVVGLLTLAAYTFRPLRSPQIDPKALLPPGTGLEGTFIEIPASTSWVRVANQHAKSVFGSESANKVYDGWFARNPFILGVLRATNGHYWGILMSCHSMRTASRSSNRLTIWRLKSARTTFVGQATKRASRRSTYQESQLRKLERFAGTLSLRN
ncbi:MAG: hypothetical protein ABR586_06635 [Thermoplasmatota archaeon]